MTVAWGNATDRIIAALEEHGPMTRTQAQLVSGVEKHTAGQVVSRLLKVVRRGEGVGTRRAHICAWVHEQDGQRDYLRAVYTLGDGKDKPRPPPKNMLLVKREYWARRKQRLAMTKPGRDLSSAWHQPLQQHHE